jgi:hypothetical protein
MQIVEVNARGTRRVHEQELGAGSEQQANEGKESQSASFEQNVAHVLKKSVP